MSELETADLALKNRNLDLHAKTVHLSKCSALRDALTLDKTELNINRSETSWAPTQRENLLSKYYALLMEI